MTEFAPNEQLATKLEILKKLAQQHFDSGVQAPDSVVFNTWFQQDIVIPIISPGNKTSHHKLPELHLTSDVVKVILASSNTDTLSQGIFQILLAPGQGSHGEIVAALSKSDSFPRFFLSKIDQFSTKFEQEKLVEQRSSNTASIETCIKVALQLLITVPENMISKDFTLHLGANNISIELFSGKIRVMELAGNEDQLLKHIEKVRAFFGPLQFSPPSEVTIGRDTYIIRKTFVPNLLAILSQK